MNRTYLTDDPTVNEQVARIEEGVYADADLGRTARQFSVSAPQTAFERLAEDARWAALSGPVRVIRPATVTCIGNRRRKPRKAGQGVAA